MAMDTITGAVAAPYIQQQYAGQFKISPLKTSDADLNASSPSAQPDDQVRLKHSAAATRNLDTARSIEQMHAQLNQLAKGIRKTNEGLVQATEKSEQMRGTLQTILKTYPPFSIEDSERQKNLMSYVSIRKEIEQLMVPPPPPPVYEKVKHMWDSLFSENGQMLSSAVPALTPSSSDRQLKDAARALSETGERLASLSTSITEALTGR
jgi:hypothetical protein